MRRSEPNSRCRCTAKNGIASTRSSSSSTCRCSSIRHPAGIDGPPGDPNLKRFDLDIIVGFGAQEAIAVATLIFGGVLDRHPKLDVWISHGGGAIPVMVGRLAQAAKKRPWASEAHRKDGAFEGLLSRLWFDTHLSDDRALKLLKQIVGTQRLTYGTNFAGWDQSDGGDHGPIDPVFADNARRLLRKARDDRRSARDPALALVLHGSGTLAAGDGAAAAAAGFTHVGLRLLNGQPGRDPAPLLQSAALRRETLALMRAHWAQRARCERARLVPATDMSAFGPFLEAAAEMGARHVLATGDDPDRPRLLARAGGPG